MVEETLWTTRPAATRLQIIVQFTSPSIFTSLDETLLCTKDLRLFRPLEFPQKPFFFSQDVEKTRLESGRETDQDVGDLLREEGLLPPQGVGKNCPKRKRWKWDALLLFGEVSFCLNNAEPSPLWGNTGPGWYAKSCKVHQEFFKFDQNGLAFYTGPLLPPRSGGSLFESRFRQNIYEGMPQHKLWALNIFQKVDGEILSKCFLWNEKCSLGHFQAIHYGYRLHFAEIHFQQKWLRCTFPETYTLFTSP